MSLNVVSLWPNVSRAIEVAKLGGFSVTIYFNPNEYPKGYEDYNLIKKYYAGWFDNFDCDGLQVEIKKPQSYEVKCRESLSDIQDRVNLGLKNVRPDFHYNDSMSSIMERATEYLNLSGDEVIKIKEITTVISQLDNKKLDTVHFAEAINYFNTKGDVDIVCAEDYDSEVFIKTRLSKYLVTLLNNQKDYESTDFMYQKFGNQIDLLRNLIFEIL